MDNLENWEETISSKFNEQHIPFDEMDWDRAEEKIDAWEKSRKRKKWFGIYFIGMVSGSLLMFGAQKLFFSGENKTTQIVYVNSNQNSNSQNSVAANNNSNAANNTNSNSVANNPAQNPVGENNTQKIVANNSNGNSFSNISVNPIHRHVNVSTQNNSSNNSVSSNATADQSNSVATVEMKNTNSSNDNSQAQFVSPSDNRLNQPNNAIAKEVVPVDTNRLVPMENKNNVARSRSNLPTSLDSIRHRMNHFIVEVGGNYLMGWYHPAEGRGFNPVGGFVFAHEFNSGYTGTIGVRYEQVGHLEDSQKKFVDSNPGFGLNNSSTIIVPATLRYVSVPMKFEKSFTGNIFGIGANISYLVNTTSRLESWTENDSHQLTIIDTHTESGYLGGFHRWDAAINVSYRRQLLPKFGIQMEATYGLNDVKNNYYFTNSRNAAEHIFGFRAMLTYRIF